MNKVHTLDSAELISEEVNDVINQQPHWIIRKGTNFLLLIALIIIISASFINLPDKIDIVGSISTLDPPKLVLSRAEGKLLRLMVEDQQYVEKGQSLGIIESIADYNSIEKVYVWLKEAILDIQVNEFEKLFSRPLPNPPNLGEIQSEFQTFFNMAMLTKQTISTGYFQQRKSALAGDLQYLAKINQNSELQRQYAKEDQELISNEYLAYEKLAKDKVIAPMELNIYKSKLIGKNQNLKQLTAQIEVGHVNFRAKLSEMHELDQKVLDQQQSFKSLVYELKSQVENWMKKFVIIAPEKGRIIFVANLRENQFVSLNKVLFYLEPPQLSFFLDLTAAQKGFGKIAMGQRIIVRVEGYPVEEFGNLIGNVSYISTISTGNDSFTVRGRLMNGMITTFDRKLKFSSGLKVTARIITKERSVLQRIVGTLFKEF